MRKLFLKFTDRAEAETVLADLGIVPTDGILPCDGAASDGTMYALDVVFGTGIIMNDGVPVHGYHINMVWCGDAIPDALVPYHKEPVTPACVFA